MFRIKLNTRDDDIVWYDKTDDMSGWNYDNINDDKVMRMSKRYRLDENTIMCTVGYLTNGWQLVR